MYTAAQASPFGRSTSFASAYRQIGAATGITGATPHKLVAMLFDGFLDALAQARGSMRERQPEAKGRAIARAVRIIEEGLQAGLDREAGGELAQRLYELYDYITLQLARAHLNNDEQRLDECRELIEPLRSAWQTIGAQVAAVPV